eukprot:6201310-Pleurochrysis_carterae.AAC.2
MCMCVCVCVRACVRALSLLKGTQQHHPRSVLVHSAAGERPVREPSGAVSRISSDLRCKRFAPQRAQAARPR